MPSLIHQLLISCILVLQIQPANAIDIWSEMEKLSLTKRMEYFLDTDHTLDWHTALTATYFQPIPDNNLTLGLSGATLWSRVTLHNPETVPLDRHLRIDTPRLENVTLYITDIGHETNILRNGVQVSPTERPIPGRNILFPLHIKPNQSITLLLQIQSRTPLSFKASLWSPQALENSERKEHLVALISIGIILGFSLYAILFYPLHRDRSHFIMGAVMVSFSFFEASYFGYSYLYLWSNSPEWALRAPSIFLNSNVLLLALFIKEFLPLRSLLGSWSKHTLNALMAFQAACLGANILGLPFEDIRIFMPALFLLSIMIPFLLAALCMWNRYQPAQMLTLSLSILVLTMIYRVGESKGLFPMIPASNFSVAVVPILNILLFLSAIRKRVDLLEQEKNDALQHALTIKTESANQLEEQVKLQTAELRSALEKAKHADRTKGELLMRVSHELRSPLHNILGYTHLLTRSQSDNHTAKYLSSIQQGGQHLSKLIDDLLDYAQAERGKITLHPQKIFLYSFLEQIDSEGSQLAKRQQNGWKFHAQERLPAAISIDTRLLRQVLLVLLSNAGKYTHNGIISLQVTKEVSLHNSLRLTFQVTDTGKGISSKELELIFLPFTQGSNNTQSEGLGLGLSISKQILHAMGSQLNVESTPSQGSRFWFTIDVEPVNEQDIPIEPDGHMFIGYTPPQRQILIVEDNALHREFIQQLLEDLGFVCHCAATIEESRQLMLNEPFDLAILDQQLPDGTAWDLLKTFSRHPQISSMPTILLSATPAIQPDHWNHSLKFDDIHKKPIAVTRLLTSIGQLLQLQWQYKDAPTTPESTSSPLHTEDIDHNQLLEQLADYAHEGAIFELESKIKEAKGADKTLDPLLSKIEQHLEQLDFKGIIQLVEEAIPPH